MVADVIRPDKRDVHPFTLSAVVGVWQMVPRWVIFLTLCVESARLLLDTLVGQAVHSIG